MQDHYHDINTITALHEYYNYGKPKHPLISIIDLAVAKPHRPEKETIYRTAFYTIMCKRFKGTVKYGRSVYDFAEGTLMFMAPHQAISVGRDISDIEGWGLFFHPGLLNGTPLGNKISEYSFFHYDTNEALHISDDENKILLDVLEKIRMEYTQNMDKHTVNLIADNLQLLLSYCNRFYDRQFITRGKVNNDIVQRFEKLLRTHFYSDTLVETGLPDVKQLAAQLSLSPSYLSDLLKRYTGKTTQEHLHLALINRAKTLLTGTAKSVSEIAFELGFQYPSHFTALFKAKTGQTPRDFRLLN